MTKVFCDRCKKEICDGDSHVFFHCFNKEQNANCEYIICETCHEEIKPVLSEFFKDVCKYAAAGFMKQKPYES